MTAKKQEVDINIKIDLAHLSQPPQAKVSTEKPTERIKTSLSVAQIAFLIYVFTEMGIIKTKNISELLRMVADKFSTPRAEQISWDSLRIKFYNPDSATISAIKDLTIKQLNFLQKFNGNK